MNNTDQFNETIKCISNCVGREDSHGVDLQRSTCDLEKVELETPDMGATPTQRSTHDLTCKEKIEKHVHRSSTPDDNMYKLCSLVLGRSTQVMEAKLNASKEMECLKKNHDGIQLIKALNWRVSLKMSKRTS